MSKREPGRAREPAPYGVNMLRTGLFSDDPRSGAQARRLLLRSRPCQQIKNPQSAIKNRCTPSLSVALQF